MLLAVSGGRDSMVLMHAAASVAAERATVVHVDHGLHPASAHWAGEVQREAEALGLPALILNVQVQEQGEGPEAAAREARYAALASVMRPGACLLTAHHRRDQAETFLLQLLRGAGPDGLAGMPTDAAFAGGRHLRPLLALAHGAIVEHAQHHELRWSEDPSNRDANVRRSFLREEVLPRIQSRWPGAEAAIARSAALCAESARRDRLLAADDLGDSVVAEALPVTALAGLAEDRRRNALRAWLTLRGVQPPPARRITAFLEAALTAAEDRHPRMAWGVQELARFRGRLHLLPRLDAPDPQARWDWDGEGALDLGPAAGSLQLEPGGQGLDPAVRGRQLEVRLRQGGERLRLVGRTRRRALKDLLREAACPPWLRSRVPLLYVDGELAAAGPWWTDQAWISDGPGLRMKWMLNDGLQVPDLEGLNSP